MKSIIWPLILVWMTLCAHEIISPQLVRACFPESYISVGKLFEFCRVPGECGKVLECEGQTTLVKGSVDYDNVFEHSRYPQLPYEKFLLMGDEGEKIDVLAVSPDSAPLFKIIFAAQKKCKQRTYLKATIRGIDLPIMGTCRREIRLEINSPEDISIR